MAQQQQGFYITGEEVTYLDGLIGNIPTKFGLPLVQFFQAVTKKRQEEEQAQLAKQAEQESSNKAADNEPF